MNLGVLQMNHLTNYIFTIKAVFELGECKKAYEFVVFVVLFCSLD